MVVYGINPVLEALRAGRVTKLHVSRRKLGAPPGDAGAAGGLRSGGLVPPPLGEIAALATRGHIQMDLVEDAVLARVSKGGVHQGVAATLREPDRYAPADLVRGAVGAPLIVVLDGIEDPHNVGAILRTADAAGVDGVVRQTRRAASLGGAAAKASAGAVAHVKVADVVNIARALEELKSAGVWTMGLAADGDRRYDEIDYTLPSAIVLGAEGSGLRRLVRERCDWTVSIPMAGHVESLNVSVAAGVVLFEALRQRKTTDE